MCVCVCVCVFARARARRPGNVLVCVCVWQEGPGSPYLQTPPPSEEPRNTLMLPRVSRQAGRQAGNTRDKGLALNPAAGWDAKQSSGHLRVIV